MSDPNKTNNEEVDIIVLFEYFRKGFWNFIQLIGGIFLFFFKLIVRLYLLLKKNWLLVGAIILGFGVLGKFYHQIIPKPYYYEMVVRANYSSVYELYNFVESVKKDLEVEQNQNLLAKKLGYSVNDIESITNVDIAPVEDFDDVLATYYGKKGSPFTPSVRDSIFYKDYTIEKFQKEIIQPINYSLQKVSLESTNQIDPVKFEESLLENVNNFSIFKSQKDARIKALTVKEKALKNQLSRIDSLLLNLSTKSVGQENTGFSLRGEAKSNVENDLLEQSRQITEELFSLELEKEKQQRILVPFSSIRQVNPKHKISPSLFTGLVFGSILSVIILLMIELNRALIKYAKHNIKD